MRGRIFDIQRFCLHDGPGLRTVVFLKGCPLWCRWCSNPESLRLEKDLLYSSERCMSCGSCVAVCGEGAWAFNTEGKVEIDRDKCTVCGNCAEACPKAALVIKGEDVSVKYVIDEILKDSQVYESTGGGVTFSGGEPFFQADFLYELLATCKENGLLTNVETSLFAPWEKIERCLPLLDYFMCDIKHTNPEMHAAWTEVSNDLIMENMKKLLKAKDEVIVRIPVIPGFNTTDEAIEGFEEFLTEVKAKHVELLPYHMFGENKYAMLGREYPAAQVNVADAGECAQRLYEKLSGKGFEIKLSS